MAFSFHSLPSIPRPGQRPSVPNVPIQQVGDWLGSAAESTGHQVQRDTQWPVDRFLQDLNHDTTHRYAADFAGGGIPVGLIYNRSRRGGMTKDEALQNSLTLGLNYHKIRSGQIARENAASEQAALEASQGRRDGLIAQLRETFGLGTTQNAATNARTLSDYLSRYQRSALNANLGDIDQRYGAATRVSRQNLARVGQLGSGLDASAARGNLSDFIRSRQKAVAAAAKSKQELSTDLTATRVGLEGQINDGTLANPDFTALGRQNLSRIDSAQRDLLPAAVGQAFRQAGETYRGGQVAAANGNQGLTFFGGGGGSNGRIS